MAVLLHLSDLHIEATNDAQRVLFDKLVETVAREEWARKDENAVLVVTGDVFDSGTDRPDNVLPIFLDLHARIVSAVGGKVPTIVLPGNHDRRWRGWVGPHRSALFDALRARVDPSVMFVAGCNAPFHAEIVPETLHGLLADVVAYDSTHLSSGLVSAGGLIRQEDLLQVHAELGSHDRDRPLVILLHHHLIPTPFTDVSFIERRGAPRIARWLVGKALPSIVSNADREELTMTALGAGTALSTLHAFGRPVLLLHGHKHFPTARLVQGLVSGFGDLLIASAGSAGLRERVHATEHPEAARLWPSFNVVKFDGSRLAVETVSFSPKRSNRPTVRRDLADVTRRAMRWEPGTVPGGVRDCAMKVDRDEASFTLSPSKDSTHHWDYACERRIHLSSGSRLRRYVEFVQPGVTLPPVRVRAGRRRLELELDGVTQYSIRNGLRRSRDAPGRTRDASPAFESVSLLSRYGGRLVTLSVAHRVLSASKPFASETDLSTGRVRPAPIEVSADEWCLRIADCPPRTLLRIYWPLET